MCDWYILIVVADVNSKTLYFMRISNLSHFFSLKKLSFVKSKKTEATSLDILSNGGNRGSAERTPPPALAGHRENSQLSSTGQNESLSRASVGHDQHPSAGQQENLPQSIAGHEENPTAENRETVSQLSDGQLMTRL